MLLPRVTAVLFAAALTATAPALPALAQTTSSGSSAGYEGNANVTLTPMTDNPVTDGYTQPADVTADPAAAASGNTSDGALEDTTGGDAFGPQTTTTPAATPATTPGFAPGRAATPPTVSDMVDRAASTASSSTFVPFQHFDAYQTPDTPQHASPLMAGVSGTAMASASVAGTTGEASATLPAAPGMASGLTAAQAPTSGSVDVDFLRGMIAHHQNAIDMSKMLIKSGSDPYVKMLANDIISAQDREIEWMKSWLAAHGPNPALAKDVGTPPNHNIKTALPPLSEKAAEKPAAKAKADAKKKTPAKKKPTAAAKVDDASQAPVAPAAEGSLDAASAPADVSAEAPAPAKKVEAKAKDTPKTTPKVDAKADAAAKASAKAPTAKPATTPAAKPATKQPAKPAPEDETGGDMPAGPSSSGGSGSGGASSPADDEGGPDAGMPNVFGR